MTASMSRRALLRGGAPLAIDRQPPWTDSTFVDTCIRCGDCIDACPESILIKGDGGFPQVTFANDGCTLCGDCATACPEPVFDFKREAFEWRARIESTCLALNNIQCQSCQDSCETDAIRFRPTLGRVPQPEVITDDCTGCGACTSVCPQDAIALEKPDDGTQQQEAQ